MTRISFVNGDFVPHKEAFIHIEDRGFLFADGIYEVILFFKNKIIDFDKHITRLYHSLNGLKINNFKYTEAEIKKIVLQLFKENNLETGSVYLQVTRGTAPRTLNFPENTTPTFIATVSPLTSNLGKEGLKNIKVMTDTDIRWGRCNIKSIALIASSMAKQKAVDLGFDDAVLIRDGYITEGTFSNIFIVDHNNTLITREADNYILSGITRDRLLNLASVNNLKIELRKFTYNELLSAKEAFLTSSTIGILPITSVDKNIIGNGKIGAIALRLSKLYLEFILE